MTPLARHLHQPGQIAIIPTDTVYGVAARAADPRAVANLYKLKQREGKPGTLVAANIEQLVALGIEQHHIEPARRYWPGPVSVVTPCGDTLHYIHQGIGSLAVRLPSDPWLRELLDQTGPLLTSSANQPGEPPATTIEEARAYFGDQVDWYEDRGYIHSDPSTVIRIQNGTIEILRQGAGKMNT